MHADLSPYAELHCRSNFSFLTGASHPEELVARAQALGYSALAVTDEGSLAGVVRAHAEAKRLGLHLVIGAEMRLTPPGTKPAAPPATPADASTPATAAPAPSTTPPAMRLVVHAMNRRGYGNLSQWVTVARRRAGKGEYIAHPSDLEGRVPHAPFLAGLPGCMALLVPAPGDDFKTVFAQAMWLKTWFGAATLKASSGDRCSDAPPDPSGDPSHHLLDDSADNSAKHPADHPADPPQPDGRAGLALSLLHRAGDAELADVVRRVADFTGLPIVATGDVLMHRRSRKPLQDVLTATRLNRPVAACGRQLVANAEQHLRSRGRLMALYEPAWLEATLRWAARCAFSLDELRYEYPQEIVPPGTTPATWLRALTEAGLQRRYGPREARAAYRSLAERAKEIVGAGPGEAQGRGSPSSGSSTDPHPNPLPQAGEGANSTLRHRRFAATEERPLPPEAAEPSRPPLPLAGEGWGEGRHKEQQGRLNSTPCPVNPPPHPDHLGSTSRQEGAGAVQEGLRSWRGAPSGGPARASAHQQPIAVHCLNEASSASEVSLNGGPTDRAPQRSQGPQGPDQRSVPPAQPLPPPAATQQHTHDIPTNVRTQIEHELALIGQLGYEAYFLTVADIVDWARSQGILCQGRGSAANSAVCYALGITEVDPARMSVLFERFISAERNEPPDIDVDFEHQRREEVIQYLYRKYGRHRAALTGVVISYRPRSALRDVGRALGIDLQRIDAVSKSQHWFDGKRVAPERLAENGFDPASPICQMWVELTQQLIGFPRHLSQHPGGFVIARDQLAQLVPVENAAMAGRSVIQWDKDDLDTLGLLKVDILALGMLSAIRRALALIADKLQMPFEMQDVPPDDAPTYEMLCQGDSVGVFQVESRAQMSMLPRLKPRCFYDLVIEVAIVRPGPIQGGMVHPYLRRRNGEEPVDFPSSEIAQALKRTLGVPIFQEQVMQLAVLAADFTPGEADSLRRAMAAWKRKGGLGFFHERLVGRMVEKGYERDFAESIFRQIQGFGEYGFPESHAASFALLVYVSAWIKRHHPDAFLAALLNSLPMGFYAPAQLVRDAREHGVQVQAVQVAVSGWESSLEADPDTGLSAGRAVRLGLNRLSGFREEAAHRIVQARASGAFTSAEDLARRATLDAFDLQLLADGNALQGLASHRHAAAWAVKGVDTRATALLQQTRTTEDAALLAPPSTAEDTLADYRSQGLTLGAHPLALLRQRLDAYRVEPAAVLRTYPDGRLARASGIVTHRQRPETAKGVVFITLEDDTGHVNVIVWPDVVEAQRKPLLAATLLTVYGLWQREGAVMHLIAKRLVDHTALLQQIDAAGLPDKSRNFR